MSKIKTWRQYNKYYENGKAINAAAHLEIDAVIDPADMRQWIMQGLRSVPAERSREACHAFVDPW